MMKEMVLSPQKKELSGPRKKCACNLWICRKCQVDSLWPLCGQFSTTNLKSGKRTWGSCTFRWLSVNHRWRCLLLTIDNMNSGYFKSTLLKRMLFRLQMELHLYKIILWTLQFFSSDFSGQIEQTLHSLPPLPTHLNWT